MRENLKVGNIYAFQISLKEKLEAKSGQAISEKFTKIQLGSSPEAINFKFEDFFSFLSKLFSNHSKILN